MLLLISNLQSWFTSQLEALYTTRLSLLQEYSAYIDHQPRLGLQQNGNRWFGQGVQRHLSASLRFSSLSARSHPTVGLQARERHPVVRPPWHKQDSDGTPDRQDAERPGAQDSEHTADPLLDKYVGESEANVRRVFAEAEEEEKRMGPNSGLHIIIFDEIDAICKQRGSVGSNTGVHDTVVNQLLAKIDGVEQLNNILVIGMTNRRVI